MDSEPPVAGWRQPFSDQTSADQGNHSIRKITSGGQVTTYAGDGGQWQSGLKDGAALGEARFNWPRGLAVDDNSGIVYVADRNNHRIRIIYP